MEKQITLFFGTFTLKVFGVNLSMIRVVGFFVAAMSMGLIFHGLVEFLQSYHLF